MTRRHRLEREYRSLWRAVHGAIRSAKHDHPDILIPNVASVTKRVVGSVLPLVGGAGGSARPVETAGRERATCPHCGGSCRPPQAGANNQRPRHPQPVRSAHNG